ncbi:Apoptosis 1 inhibitor [Camponotus japonicus]
MKSYRILSISIDEVDHIDYRFESMRLMSFANCVSTVNSQYHNFASAGFYYIQNDDKIKCFDCDVIISDWKDIDPMAKHQQQSPRCRIVRGISCGNVPIGDNPNMIPPRVPKVTEIWSLDRLRLNPNHMIEIYFDDREVVKKVKIGDVWRAKYPHFAYYERRLESYVSWPETIPQKKEDLAAAGLICANDGDTVACFYCGQGLQRWEATDDPKNEHIKWSPDCAFINRLLAENQS